MDAAPPLLPSLNAVFNAIAATFLIFGWRAIRRRNAHLHKKLMLSALTASTLFLISYLAYHFIAGTTRYQGEGIWRGIYFFILLTHTPLAALILPLCAVALWHAFRGRFDRHVRVTRVLLPAWLYVSLTGIIIYLMLYIFS